MKKIFLIIVGSFCTSAFAQNTMILSRNDLLAGTVFDNRITGASGKTLKYDEISGSAYQDKSFKNAKIAENYEITAIRYNSYKDEVEFRNDTDIMILPKENKFSRLEISSPKQVLVLISLDNEPNGYYYELVNGKSSLYKKVKTNFIDVKPASTPYGSDQPASFSTPITTYYLVLNGKVIKKPKNQKQIIDLLPDKKEVLNSFFKENKIKLDKEEDLKKLVTFLNQN
ncbi:hypothetical protein LNP04_13025 [Chryseobacterium sp. C-71]|uniref:hypothetical protein n=1 Tax=Chryseobacterium sp. C-71 TaxID=2893882 RepID=UPI001E3BC7AC|nr:hypothetical protein [Chryseobacterium sp. C-71]UFH30898.1 hypothetical protein LNP04_13025 [Chryseobacterium sp. C-71]